MANAIYGKKGLGDVTTDHTVHKATKWDSIFQAPFVIWIVTVYVDSVVARLPSVQVK